MLWPVRAVTWPGVRRCEKFARIRTTSRADTRNDAASMTKAASRPSVPATSPPRAAPTASMVPHDAEVRVLAAARSSGATRFGRLAPDAGWKNALRADIPARQNKPIHTVSGDLTSSIPRARTIRIRSVATMSRLRSKRSANEPEIGASRNCGRIEAARIMPALRADPVRSSTSPRRATVVNQSPPSEISCADQSFLKSELVVRRRRMSPLLRT
jgi:hypothetical protein